MQKQESHKTEAESSLHPFQVLESAVKLLPSYFKLSQIFTLKFQDV